MNTLHKHSCYKLNSNSIFCIPFCVLILLFIFTASQAQRYPYDDLLGKSLFFVEANACGKKLSTSTVPWRDDCHLQDGNGAFIGGFHDAGDHVKFNYPMALPIYTLALSYLDYKEQYQKTNNEERILGILRHAGEYMIRCHPSPNEYIIQVGLGQQDHRFWQSPEENTYFRDVLRINTNKPGSDLAAPTAGAMAAVSLVFKDIDPTFSASLLTHARQLFAFADQYRGPFSDHIPANERSFYESQKEAIDQIDDLMIGAVWLYRRTAEQSFKTKADQFFEQTKYRATGFSPSFGDHQYQAHMIMSQITGDPKYINESVRGHINKSLDQHFTDGGMWIYSSGHNEFNSYQAIGNAYLAYALAEFVGTSDSNYQAYKNYAIRQIEYFSGRNPRNSSYIGGFGPNFPKRIHHRAANNDTTLRSGAPDDQYVLYGALVAGPDSNDNFANDRTNHQQTEPTLSPNSLLTILAAQMVKEYDLGQETSSNRITSTSAPDAVSPGQNVTVKVAYVSDGNHDIRVAFQSVSEPDYTVYGETIVPIEAGTKTMYIQVPIAENTPIKTDEYQFQTFITKRGGTYDDRFDNKAITGIDCISQSVATSNDVDNGTFKNGASSWQLWTSANAAGSLTTNAENGAVSITEPGDEVFDIQLRQKISLRKGHYALQFTGKSDALRTIQFRITKASPDYQSFFSQTENLTPTATSFENYLWYSEETTEDRYLQFLLGKNTTNVQIDDVAMIRYNNQLPNTSFNTNLDNWILYNNSSNTTGVDLSRESNAAKIAIGSGGSLDHDIQFYTITSLQKGVTYALLFEASAAQSRSFDAKLQLHSSPYTSLAALAATATTSPKYYTLWFTADKDYPEARVQFNLGGNDGDITFDNITLLKPEHTTLNTMQQLTNKKQLAIAKPNKDQINIYPNPNSDGKLVVQSSHTITQVTINDLAGKRMASYTYPTKEKTQSINSSPFPNGLYMVHVQNELGTVSQIKLVIQK